MTRRLDFRSAVVMLLVVIASVSVNACSESVLSGGEEDPGSGLYETQVGRCTFTVVRNVYDARDWWGTITFRYSGPVALSSFSIAFDIPSGARCDYAEGGWRYTQNGSTCVYTRPGTKLKPGTRTVLHYSTTSQAFNAASNIRISDPACEAAPPPATTDATPTLPRVDSRPALEPDAGPVLRPDSRPVLTPDSRPATKPDSRPALKSDSRPALKPDSSATPKPDSSPALQWRQANLTWFTSYPDPGSEECIEYNGCTWAGQFAALSGTQPKSWVQANNIAAVHSKDFATYKLKTLRLKQGTLQIDVKVYDMCADSDCSGCCTANSKTTGFLIDLESYTAQRFGANSGIVQWACLDCN